MATPGSTPPDAQATPEPASPGGTLPPASRSVDEEVRPAGTLPAAADDAGTLPPAEAEAPEPDAEADDVEADDVEAPSETRRARIQRATSTGGLTALPDHFADADGDWRVAEAEDPFERLFLDAEQHGRITPALVQQHYDLLGGFWRQVVADLDGPGRAAVARKYGGPSAAPETVRQWGRRTEEAYRRLTAEGGIEAAFAEVDARRRERATQQMAPTLRGVLVDGELSAAETDALFGFGRQYGLKDDETADLIQDALHREGFAPYGDPRGDSLAQRLLSVPWMTAERREALERQRTAVRQAQVQPLKLRDATLASLDELIAYADAHRDTAVQRFYDGTFGDWIRGSLGEVRLRDETEAIRTRWPDDPNVGTELFVRRLAAEVGAEVAPRLTADRAEIALGTLAMGQTASVTLALTREGPRRAWGTIEVEGALPGLSVPARFGLNVSAVPVRVDTARVPPGTYEGALVVRPEGGASLRFPVSMTVIPLTVALAPRRVDFGGVPFNVRKHTDVAVRCTPGEGRLVGTARIEPEREGVAVTGEIDGVLSMLQVQIDTARFDPGKGYDGTLHLDLNTGRFEVPVSFRVKVAWARVVAWTVGLGGILAALLFGYRRFLATEIYGLRGFAPDNPQAAVTFNLALGLGLVLGMVLVRRLYRGARTASPAKKASAKKKTRRDGNET